MKLRLLVAVFAVAGFANLSPRASAELITLNYQGETTNPGNPTAVVSLNGTTYTNTPAGPFYWSQNQTVPNSNFPPAVATFCIELAANQPLPSIGSNVVFDVVSPNAAPTIGNDPLKVAAISELYGRYFQTAWLDKNTFHGSVDSVAFQLALWELVYDGATSKNLSDGSFTATGQGTYTSTAQDMLNSLNGSNAFNTNLGGYELVALLAPATTDPSKKQDQVQDQLTLRPKPVPAPPAVLLAGIGMLALIGRARLTRPADRDRLRSEVTRKTPGPHDAQSCGPGVFVLSGPAGGGTSRTTRTRTTARSCTTNVAVAGRQARSLQSKWPDTGGSRRAGRMALTSPAPRHGTTPWSFREADVRLRRTGTGPVQGHLCWKGERRTVNLRAHRPGIRAGSLGWVYG